MNRHQKPIRESQMTPEDYVAVAFGLAIIVVGVIGWLVAVL